jgi:hypothetical protein
MSDADSNGSQPPQLSAEELERLRVALIHQVAQQTQQVLGLVGFIVDERAVLAAAAEEFNSQDELLSKVMPTFHGGDRNKHPLFAAILGKQQQALVLTPGQRPEPPMQVVGPKKLDPRNLTQEIVGTLLAIMLMMNPALRAAYKLLGVRVVFQQMSVKPAPVPPRIVL